MMPRQLFFSITSKIPFSSRGTLVRLYLDRRPGVGFSTTCSTYQATVNCMEGWQKIGFLKYRYTAITSW
jgi:hypothetical protein